VLAVSLQEKLPLATAELQARLASLDEVMTTLDATRQGSGVVS
jgi:hypothetical protein